MEGQQGKKDKINSSFLKYVEAWLDRMRIGHQGIYPVDALPEECPWQFSQTTEIRKIISSLFSQLEKNLPKTIVMMQERCVAMFGLWKDNQWHLLYMIKFQLRNGSTDFTVYYGGEPTAYPQLREELGSHGWWIPHELKELYQVHNGFGKLAYSRISILPDRKLTLLSEYFFPDEEVAYNPNDLLEFFPDGAGNAQFFHRATGGKPMRTIDWDHETRELSNPEEFWGFIDRKLSDVDEARFDWPGRLIRNKL